MTDVTSASKCRGPSAVRRADPRHARSAGGLAAAWPRLTAGQEPPSGQPGQARTPQAAVRPALQACRLLASVHLVASTFLPHYDRLFPDQTPPLPGSLPDSSQAEVFTLPWAAWTLCHPELGHLPALSEPLWRGRGEARSGPLLGSAQSPAHRWRSVSGRVLCACLRAGPQWRAAVPWDWPGARQLEPRLPACGVPGRVCTLTGVLLRAQPRPPLVPRGPRCSPGIPGSRRCSWGRRVRPAWPGQAAALSPGQAPLLWQSDAL